MCGGVGRFLFSSGTVLAPPTPCLLAIKRRTHEHEHFPQSSLSAPKTMWLPLCYARYKRKSDVALVYRLISPYTFPEAEVMSWLKRV